MKKRGLGKGLEALLGEDAVGNNEEAKNSQLVAISEIRPSPFQPRAVFDESAIEMLADSIRQHGIIQPIAVRPIQEGRKACFEIIAGERRFRAAQRIGLVEVPVIIHDVSDHDSASFALIENLQREDLNVIEKARGIERLIGDFKLTHEACGKLLGQSRSSISNTLRLLELSDVVQDAIAEKSIDMGHARALLGVEQAEQYELLQKIKLNGLSVRETEELARGEKSKGKKNSNKKYNKNPQTKQAEIKLSEHLGAKVSISQQANGSGKIVLVFNDDVALDQLIQRLAP